MKYHAAVGEDCRYGSTCPIFMLTA